MKINTKLAFDPTLALSRFMLANKPEVGVPLPGRWLY
jgi:hypothetical protein